MSTNQRQVFTAEDYTIYLLTALTTQEDDVRIVFNQQSDIGKIILNFMPPTPDLTALGISITNIDVVYQIFEGELLSIVPILTQVFQEHDLPDVINNISLGIPTPPFTLTTNPSVVYRVNIPISTPTLSTLQDNILEKFTFMLTLTKNSSEVLLKVIAIEVNYSMVYSTAPGATVYNPADLSLEDLPDVNPAGVVNGDTLVWDAGNSEFIVFPTGYAPDLPENVIPSLPSFPIVPAPYEDGGKTFMYTGVTTGGVNLSSGVAIKTLTATYKRIGVSDVVLNIPNTEIYYKIIGRSIQFNLSIDLDIEYLNTTSGLLKEISLNIPAASGTVGYPYKSLITNFSTDIPENFSYSINYTYDTNGDSLDVSLTNLAEDMNAVPSVNVASTSMFGIYMSTIIASGNPAVCFYNFQSGDLVFMRSQNTTGASWATTGTNYILLDSVSNVGQYNSMAVLTGASNFIGVAYLDVTSYNIKYVRSTIATGSTWVAPIVVSNAGSNVGLYLNLIIANSNPAIIYYDAINGDLKIIRADSTNGSTWGTLPVNIATTGDIGIGVSARIINNNPAVAYFDSLGNLYYNRSTDTSGTIWGAPISIDSTGGVGGISLNFINSTVPAISYYYTTGKSLRYISASDINGAAWNSIENVYADDSGSYSVLLTVSSTPAIVFYSNKYKTILYIRSTGISTNSWTSPVATATNTASISGLYFNSLINSTAINITYYSLESSSLKYAISTVPGTTWNSDVNIIQITNVNIGISAGNTSSSNPYVVFSTNQTPLGLYYSRANNQFGDTWSSPVPILQTAPFIVTSNTFYSVILNGNPSVFYVPLSTTLSVIRCSDTLGITESSWNSGTITTVQTTTGSASIFSVAFVNGFPAILYGSTVSLIPGVYYQRASNINGTAWNAPVLIMPGSGSNIFIAILSVVNNNPAIAMNIGGYLMYVRSDDINGSAWGTLTPIYYTLFVSVFNLSMNIIDNIPNITLVDTTTRNIIVLISNDINGTTWTEKIFPYNNPVIFRVNNLYINNILFVVFSNSLNEIYFSQAIDINLNIWTAPKKMDIGFPNSSNNLALVSAGTYIGLIYTNSTTNLNNVIFKRFTNSVYNENINISGDYLISN